MVSTSALTRQDLTCPCPLCIHQPALTTQTAQASLEALKAPALALCTKFRVWQRTRWSNEPLRHWGEESVRRGVQGASNALPRARTCNTAAPALR